MPRIVTNGSASSIIHLFPKFSTALVTIVYVNHAFDKLILSLIPASCTHSDELILFHCGINGSRRANAAASAAAFSLRQFLAVNPKPSLESTNSANKSASEGRHVRNISSPSMPQHPSYLKDMRFDVGFCHLAPTRSVSPTHRASIPRRPEIRFNSKGATVGSNE
jgi:hypothetical protein